LFGDWIKHALSHGLPCTVYGLIQS
jgi:hypothetical protein